MVSIIIPVYNVKDYIVKCLESVATQTYTGSIECLIIDDRGQDNSIQLAENFVQNYKGDIDFHIIHHEKNRGLSAARNTGIKESKGEWLFFLDSDDWIIPRCIEIMIAQVERYPDVDIVMGNIQTIGDDYDWSFANPGVYNSGFIEMSCSYKIYTMAWNKLLSKRFVQDNNLYFEEGLIHEDVLWFIQCACFMKKLVSIEEKTYNYIIREDSLQTEKSYKKHYWNNALVKVKTIDFIFKNHLENNVTLYSFINKDLYDKILEPLKTEYQKLSYDFYLIFRKVPFWSISFIRKQKTNRRELIYAYNRYLPTILGFPYLHLVHALFVWKDKRKRLK